MSEEGYSDYEEEKFDDIVLLSSSSSDDKKPTESKATLSPADQFEQEIEKHKKLAKLSFTASSNRLYHDYAEYCAFDKKELCYTAEPIDNNLSFWLIKMTPPDPGDDIYKDVARLKSMGGPDHLEFIVSFSPEYPRVPPFLRATKPRLQRGRGNITQGGSVCCNLLMDKWSPTYTLVMLLTNIFSEMLSCKDRYSLRIDFDRLNEKYSVEDAKHWFFFASKKHGWNVNESNYQFEIK